jgi:hypothetical protein
MTDGLRTAVNEGRRLAAVRPEWKRKAGGRGRVAPMFHLKYRPLSPLTP